MLATLSLLEKWHKKSSGQTSKISTTRKHLFLHIFFYMTWKKEVAQPRNKIWGWFILCIKIKPFTKKSFIFNSSEGYVWMIIWTVNKIYNYVIFYKKFIVLSGMSISFWSMLKIGNPPNHLMPDKERAFANI